MHWKQKSGTCGSICGTEMFPCRISGWMRRRTTCGQDRCDPVLRDRRRCQRGNRLLSRCFHPAPLSPLSPLHAAAAAAAAAAAGDDDDDHHVVLRMLCLTASPAALTHNVTQADSRPQNENPPCNCYSAPVRERTAKYCDQFVCFRPRCCLYSISGL